MTRTPANKARATTATRVAPAAIRMRVLAGSVVAMGPGKADLLDAIATTGSISAAARAMGMSYRRAWLLVDTMNSCFASPLVFTEKGGVEGGGATLTATGTKVLRAYRKSAMTIAKAFAPLLQKGATNPRPRG